MRSSDHWWSNKGTRNFVLVCVLYFAYLVGVLVVAFLSDNSDERAACAEACGCSE